jgi:hypothetical protein
MAAAPLHSLSRRALLGGFLGAVAGPALLTGCTEPAPPAAPTPDEVALRWAVTSAEALAAEYASATAAHPGLTARLDPLAADHRAHLDVLAGAAGSPSPSGSAEERPSPAPSAGVPADPEAAVAALAASESAAAAALAGRLGPVDGDLARTLASVSACRSAHSAALRGAP